MNGLREALKDQSDGRVPRRTKDLIEERLFDRRRSLFSRLSVVLFDTTSLYFYGAGGETLGWHGKSQDHLPGLRQVSASLLGDLARQRHRREVAAAGGGLPALRHRKSAGPLC